MRCRTDDTLRYVQFLARRFAKHDIRAVILIILIDLGFSPSNDGFTYLRSAIELHVSGAASCTIKGIYPAISPTGGDDQSWHYIDQAIRRAVKAAWNGRDTEIWELFFPFSNQKNANCPPNKEFIARISCIIELWQSCREVDYERAI